MRHVIRVLMREEERTELIVADPRRLVAGGQAVAAVDQERLPADAVEKGGMAAVGGGKPVADTETSDRAIAHAVRVY